MTTRSRSGRIPATVAALGLVTTLAVTACSDSDPVVAPASSSAAPSPTDEPTRIEVTVGVDSGDDRIEHVAAGAAVTLVITNGPEAAEYHVHGIDLEVAAEADQTVTLDFAATATGPYEVEDHETGAVILVIEVDQ